MESSSLIWMLIERMDILDLTGILLSISLFRLIYRRK